jgi:hypothetical protein
MGEYAVMAELLAKPWVENVYVPAADTGVDVILLTNEGKLKKIQVKTSRAFGSGGFWFTVSKRRILEDGSKSNMFYVFAEDRPPKDYLIFRSAKLLRLFESGNPCLCRDRLLQFTGFATSRLWVRHSGPERRQQRLAQVRQSGEQLDNNLNNWNMIK